MWGEIYFVKLMLHLSAFIAPQGLLSMFLIHCKPFLKLVRSGNFLGYQFSTWKFPLYLFKSTSEPREKAAMNVGVISVLLIVQM